MGSFAFGDRERDDVQTPWGTALVAKPTRGNVQRAREIQAKVDGLDLDDADVSFDLWKETLGVMLEDADDVIEGLSKAWMADELSFGDAQQLVLFATRSFWDAARAEKND